MISNGNNVLQPPSFFIYVDLRTVLCYHNGMTFDDFVRGDKCIGKCFLFCLLAGYYLYDLCKELHATQGAREGVDSGQKNDPCLIGGGAGQQERLGIEGGYLSNC